MEKEIKYYGLKSGSSGKYDYYEDYYEIEPLDKYYRYIDYLNKKYGEVNGNFFEDKKMTKKNNKIDKSKSEGLIIHHNYEIYVSGLSNEDTARKHGWYWQEGKNLVYCNLYEHFVLHCLMFEANQIVGWKENEWEKTCGLHWFIGEINDIFIGVEYKQEWRNKHKELVLKEKENYIKELLHLKLIGYNLDMKTFKEYNQYDEHGQVKQNEFLNELESLGL